jgi:hypothetical protein
MWDEDEINKKIKDAADQYQPAYDDKAWDKMEQTLDEQLPQKKDNRRIIFFILLFLFLGMIIYVGIPHHAPIPSSKNLEKATSKNEPNNFSTTDVAISPGGKSEGKLEAGGKVNEPSNKQSLVTMNSVGKKNNILSGIKSVSNQDGKPQPNFQNLSPTNPLKKVEDNQLLNNENVTQNLNIQNSKSESISQPSTSKEDSSSSTTANNSYPIKKSNADIIKDNNDTKNIKDVGKISSTKDANKSIKQNKLKKHFIQNFGFGLSVGPDVSAVKLNNAGKITFTYGLQLSYSINDKFTLRTGLFIAKKIYTVGAADYNVQPGGTGNYYYLQSVDANCNVDEIPLTLSYNFGKVKNHNWFASVGLSSYLMKKESYDYYYKYPSGLTNNTYRTVINKNKHYFSVLDISAGYEYNINKRFSVITEPYLKLPLSGIGIGKIKLNSAGILFTITAKPF